MFVNINIFIQAQDYIIKLRIGKIIFTNFNEWQIKSLYTDIFNSQGDYIYPSNEFIYFYEKDLCDGNGFRQWITGPRPGADELNPDGMIDSSSACDIRVNFQTYWIRVTVTIDGKDYSSDPIRLPDGGSGTLEQRKIVIAQTGNFDSNVGTIGKLYQNIWLNYPVPFTFYNPITTQNDVFKASQKVIDSTNEKYNRWIGISDVTNYKAFSFSSNSTFLIAKFDYVTNATIRVKIDSLYLTNVLKFKDPWLLEDSDQYGGKNIGINTPFFFLENLNGNLSINSGHQGVFLNQDYNMPDQPYYSMKIPSSVKIQDRSHQLYLLKWDIKGAKLQYPDSLKTGIVFTDITGAAISANLKASLLTDNTNAHSNSSQHKFIKVKDNLYLVYSSMGKIWLESSSDNGKNWNLLNNLNPLNDGLNAKNPSLCLIPGSAKIALVFQEGYTIKIIIINSQNLNSEDFILYKTTVGNSKGLTNSNPVVGVKYLSNNNSLSKTNYYVVWQNNESTSPGLYYRVLQEDYSNNFRFLNDPIYITNTNENSRNATIITNSNLTTIDFHLAWEQYLDENNSEIRYYLVKNNNKESINFSNYFVPSIGDGYSKNIGPSIILKNNNDVSIYWVGYSSNNAMDKRVVVRVKAQNGNWTSNFNKFGSYVTNVNANICDDLSTVGFVWVEEKEKSLDRFRTSKMEYNGILDSFGSSIQLCNAQDISGMYAISFNRIDSIGEFKLTKSLGSLAKSNVTNSTALQGIIRNDDVEYYCTLSDIKSDEESIGFTPLPDRLITKNLQDLSSYLKTTSFNLKNGSDITFNISYGITNLEKAIEQNENNENIKFILKLNDSKNGEEINKLYEHIFCQESNFAENKKSFKFKINSTLKRKARIQIIFETNANVETSIAKIESDKNIIPEQKPEIFEHLEINSNPINQHLLLQNYPNPFNPITTISYQLPKDEFMKLKVYDTLGNEIITLVNEYKKSGVYNINFDGSNFASGIYYYRLSADNFTETKKFVLMK